jgi:homoserine kinase type II
MAARRQIRRLPSPTAKNGVTRLAAQYRHAVSVESPAGDSASPDGALTVASRVPSTGRPLAGVLPAPVAVLDAPEGLHSDGASFWLLRLPDGRRAVLRRDDPQRVAPTRRSLDSARWVHDGLLQLEELSFPSPVPVPALSGQSVVLHEGAIWQLLTFVPGDPVGWNPQPRLEDVGAMLATFHNATSTLSTRGQRPNAFALSDLAGLVRGSPTKSPSRDWLLPLSEELEARLSGLPEAFIHGDPTAHNVVAAGRPVRPTGLIDFNLAHLSPACFDIAFALWRTGRPDQLAFTMDESRVASFVSGYAHVRPLEGGDAELIVAALWGRGVQVGVKRSLAGIASTGNRTRVEWIRANTDRLNDVVSRAATAKVGPTAP